MELDKAIRNVCDCEFPVSSSELIEDCGHIKFTTRSGESVQLSEILQICDNSPDRFNSRIELHNFIYGLAPKECIGRKNYDDRAADPTNERQELSF